jgi:hypothetical protein
MSGSIRNALDTNKLDQKATDCLWAIIRAALQLARAEEAHSPNTYIFVGVFGLDQEQGFPPVINLGSIVNALLNNIEKEASGVNRLMELA